MQNFEAIIRRELLRVNGYGQVALPSWFDNWFLPVAIYRTGFRSYEVRQKASDLMPITTEILYVSTAGSDGNPGTSTSKKATIAGALAAATGRPLILIEPGQYVMPNITRSCILEGIGGRFELTDVSSLSTGNITVGLRRININNTLTLNADLSVVFDKPLITAASGNGVRVQSTAWCYFFEAEATSVGADVISIASNGRVLEVECNFQNTGSTDADNCSTGHDSSRIVRVGGNYINAYRNVHDVNDSKSLMFGSVVNTSKGAANENDSFNIGAGFYNHAAGTATIGLFGVEARGGAFVDLYTGQGGKIYVDDETLYASTSSDHNVLPMSRLLYAPQPKTAVQSITDDFNRVDQPLSDSSNWTVLTGTPTVTSNRCYGNAGTSIVQHNTNLGTDDFEIAFDVVAAATSGTNGAMFRMGNGKGFFMGVRQDSALTYRLFEFTSPSTLTLIKAENGISNTVPFYYSLRVENGILRLFINGDLKFQFAIPNHQFETGRGVGFYLQSGTTNRIDNFSAKDV